MLLVTGYRRVPLPAANITPFTFVHDIISLVYMIATQTVSVIIPAKNRPGFTSEAIESVLNQKLSEKVKLEVIVIDNRSKPSLERLLGSKFPQVKFIRNDGYDSPGGSRNMGFNVSFGQYIAFLDNDDKWKQGFLKHSLLALRKSKAPVTVCLTDPYFYGEFPFSEKVKLIFLNIIRATVISSTELLNSKRLPFSGFYLCQISHMLFNRRYIGKIKFNEKTPAAEDWEFIAMTTSKKPARIVLKPLVKFRYEIRSNTYTETIRKKKWQAYLDMIGRIPKTHQKGILNKLFHYYIGLFSI